MNFLIDECLSPSLPRLAWDRGLQAAHVLWRGLRTRPDWEIAGYAAAGGYTIVTNNRKDFARLFARSSAHSGLVCLLREDRSIDGTSQALLFERALDVLTGRTPLPPGQRLQPPPAVLHGLGLDAILRTDRNVRIRLYPL